MRPEPDPRVGRTRPAAALAATAAVLVACASTTTLDAHWVDPQLGNRPLRGAKLLVACQSREPVIKKLCQDQLAAEVVARGGSAVTAPDNDAPPPEGKSVDDVFLQAARDAGAQGVLTAAVSPAGTADAPSGPSFSIGFGGFGFGGHSGVGAGVGISAPINGNAVPPTGYSANSKLTEVANGKLLWTARATTPASKDLNAQLAELAKAVMASAEKSGVL